MVKFKSYTIYNNGKVYSDKRGRFLKPRLTNRGYYQYNLQGEQIYIHQLMAELMLTKNDGDVVNHKDGNKLNNDIDNLEWTSQRENTLHYHGGKRLEKYGNRYRVRLWDKHNKKLLHLGIANTKEEGLKIYNNYVSQL